jgi:hypothetical protein
VKKERLECFCFYFLRAKLQNIFHLCKSSDEKKNDSDDKTNKKTQKQNDEMGEIGMKKG